MGGFLNFNDSININWAEGRHSWIWDRDAYAPVYNLIIC